MTPAASLSAALSLSPALAASFTPISEDFQLNVWNLMVLAAAIIALLASFRRKLPLESELVKLQGAIDGLQKSVEALTRAERSHAGHETEIASLRSKITLLESRREEDLRAQRNYTRETTHALFTKLDENSSKTHQKLDNFTSSVNTIFRDIAADIGALKEAAKSR